MSVGTDPEVIEGTAVEVVDTPEVVGRYTPVVEPWEPRPGETSLWYERFNYYMLMGTSRSIPRAMEYFGHPASSINNWYRQSTAFEWRERVDAWDKHAASIDAEHRLKEAEQAHESRVALIKKLYDKFEDAIDDLDDDKLKWNSAGAVLRAIVQELREEYKPPKQESTAMEVEITDAVGTLRARLLQLRQSSDAVQQLHRVVDEAPESGID